MKSSTCLNSRHGHAIVPRGLPLSLLLIALALALSSMPGSAAPPVNLPPPGSDVPAEEGGYGFEDLPDLEQQGWMDGLEHAVQGDPRAVKGGELNWWITNVPATLRVEGPGSNQAINSIIMNLLYEPLLRLNENTLEYSPCLATHWKISQDGLEYAFRINPKARWADGAPVMARDVVATWDFLNQTFASGTNPYFRPVEVSPYLVTVKCKQENWRNLLYFGVTMYIFPANELENVDMKKYVAEYDDKFLKGSGPYSFAADSFQQEGKLEFHRREEYWGWDEPQNTGLYNFDRIRFVVREDWDEALEMVKTGALDIMYVPSAEMWHTKLDFDETERGIMLKRKIFTQAPRGISGIAINMREAPLDDVRVRIALQHLLNRGEMLKTLFFDEYLRYDSYYAGGIYENSDNPVRRFDPATAVSLLEEAGWLQENRNSDGILTRDGTPLSLELLTRSDSSRTFLQMLAEDCIEVGVELRLVELPPNELWTRAMERKFQLTEQAWTGLVFPNPETSYHSRIADTPWTNNISGIENEQIDRLCAEYNTTVAQHERIDIIRQIDRILTTDEVPFILNWYGPCARLTYRNRFGHPESYLPRHATYRVIPMRWWVDPDKDEALNEALENPDIKLDPGPTEIHYWEEFTAAEDALEELQTMPALASPKKKFWKSAEEPRDEKVVLETTKGRIVLQLHADWAPNGVAHFIELVKAGVYDGAPVFRCMHDFMVQFGVPADPELARTWLDRRIERDTVRQSNKRGIVAYAMAGHPDTRSCQIFINYQDRNSFLDDQGFAPFAEVIEGMEVADSFHEISDAQFRSKGLQQSIISTKGGLERFKEAFPEADYILRAYILED